MKASVYKMVGIALVWVGLAALVNLPTADGSLAITTFASVGFVSFASGAGIFFEGFKPDMIKVARVRSQNK